MQDSPNDPPKLRDHLSGLLPAGILWIAYYIQAINISKDPHFSYHPDIAAGILGYLVHISISYFVLLLLLPPLRKRISARACGYLWLIPLLAIPLFHLGLAMDEPLLVIYIPIHFSDTVIIIWAVGTAGILLWYLVSHQFFRRKILKNAVPVMDTKTQQLWQEILNLNQFKTPYPQLLRNPDIATPLSVGSRPETMRVILPQKDYTAEELRLIFYHELIHTGRYDVMTKMAFSILAALFWFNPLMWIVLRRITEDLELSCDETTLLRETEDTRRKYADLLLRTAGSRIGFSTCLSASAKSLRYRLKNTLKPTEKASGYIIAGLFCLITLLFQGSIAFAYDSGTGADYIFPAAAERECSVLYMYNEPELDVFAPPERYQCTDEKTLYDYLSGLQLHRVTGNYWNPDTEKHCWIYLDIEMGEIYLYLEDRTITAKMIKIENSKPTASEYTYYHGGAIDWAYLFSLFEPYEYQHYEFTPEETVPAETQPQDPPKFPSRK